MTVWWTLFWLAVGGLVAWALGLDDIVRASIAAGHLLDWIMGGLCLVWLILILKAPWDLLVVSSLTDNQEVIKGIQALARLVTQSSLT
jgi:hypothetical protein